MKGSLLASEWRARMRKYAPRMLPDGLLVSRPSSDVRR